MGLDVTHDCWQGAYSAFSRFREEVALAAGYKIVEDGIYRYTDIDWSVITDENLQGEWETPPDDPLLVLLIHSDCDGKIPVAYCEHLATRLEQIIPNLRETGEGHLRFGGVKGAAQRFANGLRAAAQANEDVEFW